MPATPVPNHLLNQTRTFAFFLIYTLSPTLQQVHNAMQSYLTSVYAVAGILTLPFGYIKNKMPYYYNTAKDIH